jgi:hypothetical protein
MIEIRCTDRVRNEVVLGKARKEKKNVLHKIKRRKANWIGRILHRNCLLKHVIERMMEGGIEVTRRRGRKCKQLLGDFKERKGYRKLKEGALDAHCGQLALKRGYGLVVRRSVQMIQRRG